MEVAHLPTQINQAYRGNVWCSFCSRPFDTIAEKNAHILNHFEKEICGKCDQNLLRIGEHLYVLHGTITCIDTKIKRETEVDVLSGSTTVPNDMMVEEFQMEIENISIDYGQLNYKSECYIDRPNQYTEPTNSFLDESHIKVETAEVADEHEVREEEIQTLDKTENLPETGKTKKRTSKQSLDVKTKEKMITCQYEGCGETMKANSIRSHIIYKHAEKEYKCNVCEKAFATRFQHERHMQVHNPESKSFKCDLCGVSNIVKATLDRHLLQKSKCDQCHQTFCTDHQLKVHYASHRPEKERKNEIRKKNRIKTKKCKVEGCDEMLSKNNYSRHMIHKHGTMRFECDICKKTCIDKKQIREHILNMHDPTSKKFKCDSCGSLFLTKGMLNSHFRRVHIIAFNFVCSTCGKAYRTHNQLQIHSNSHTGAKPYKCKFEGCSKRFSRPWRRTEHLRTHTGEKPYQCSEEGCSRRFAYGIDLKRHKFNAHGIYTKQYPCNICSEILPENVLFKKHMIKHGVHLA